MYPKKLEIGILDHMNNTFRKAVFQISVDVALSNHADNKNLFAIIENKENIKSLSLSDIRAVKNYFYKNLMVLNREKCHDMCFRKNVDDNEALNVDDFNIKNRKEVEISGIKTDRNSTFSNHIKTVSRKSGKE